MKKPNLLSLEQGRPTTFEFCPVGLDSAKAFRKILKKSPPDWVYRKKAITYTHNAFGFRGKNLDTIDWNNSIIVLGCSNVYGYALAEEDIATSVVEKETNVNVVNLGVPGSSIELSFYNSVILHESGIRPLAMIQIWSCMNRYLDYDKKFKTNNNYLVWNDNFQSKINWNFKSTFYRKAFNEMWKDKTFIYEASFFKDTATEFNIDFIEPVDRGRDLVHPGIISNKALADNIIKKLKDARVVK